MITQQHTPRPGRPSPPADPPQIRPQIRPARQRSVRGSRPVTLIAMCLGAMITFLQITATVSALTTIQADLRVDPTTVIWIPSAYTLVVASLVLSAATGRTSDSGGDLDLQHRAVEEEPAHLDGGAGRSGVRKVPAADGRVARQVTEIGHERPDVQHVGEGGAVRGE